MNANPLYYELHAGFPRLLKNDGKTKVLSRTDIIERLKKVTANEPMQTEDVENTRVNVGGEQCFAEHSVPGTLDLLSTHRYTNFKEAMHGLNILREEFSGYSCIRFELEEVLASSLAENPCEMHPYDLSVHDFSGYNPILGKPIFEIHLSIRCKNSGLILSVDWQDIVRIARSLNIKLNEFVCFKGGRKITTTTFFPMLEETNPRNLEKHFNEMNRFFVHDAQRLIHAITESDSSIQIKKIAERILLVTRPN